MFTKLKIISAKKQKLDDAVSGFSVQSLIDGLKDIVDILTRNYNNDVNFYKELHLKVKEWHSLMGSTNLELFEHVRVESILLKAEEGKIIYYIV